MQFWVWKISSRVRSKCRILTTIFQNTITLVKTHGIFIWIKFFCVNCHISACQQIIIYVVHRELLSSGIGVSASRQLIIYLVHKDLLSSAIGVSASWQLIIYLVHKELLSSGIGVSASQQLIIYLVHKELLSSGIGVSASPDMFSLVLIYMNLGISAQLMFSLINVHIGTSA